MTSSCHPCDKTVSFVSCSFLSQVTSDSLCPRVTRAVAHVAVAVALCHRRSFGADLRERHAIKGDPAVAGSSAGGVRQPDRRPLGAPSGRPGFARGPVGR